MFKNILAKLVRLFGILLTLHGSVGYAKKSVAEISQSDLANVSTVVDVETLDASVFSVGHANYVFLLGQRQSVRNGKSVRRRMHHLHIYRNEVQNIVTTNLNLDEQFI